MNFTTLFAELALLLSSLNFQLDIIKDKEQKIELQNSIMICESRGNPLAVNENDKKITGYASFGLYQFQPPTFLKAGLKYKILPEGTTLKEAMKLIKNPVYNAAVAHALLEDGEFGHWSNCYQNYLAKK